MNCSAPNGTAVCTVSLATTNAWTDKQSGERVEESEWHRVVFFGRLAEVVAEYMRKGRPLYVEGRLRTRKWQDKEGQDKYTTEIVCDTMQMLGGRQGMGEGGGRGGDRGDAAESRGGPPPEGRPAPAKKPAGKFDDMEDDIPF